MAFVCAVLVVSIHLGISGPVHSCAWWLKELVAEGFARVAVPFFFVASGYFVSRDYLRTDADVWTVWRKICRRRIRTLVLPFWIWNVLYAPCLIGCSVASDVVAGRAVRDVPWVDLLGAVSGFDIVHDPVLFPLWYVRALFVFVLLSPVVVMAVRRLGWVVPFLAYMLYLLAHGVGGFIFPIDGLAYYALGFCVRHRPVVAVPKLVALLSWRRKKVM